jgi:hypothetical protein
MSQKSSAPVPRPPAVSKHLTTDKLLLDFFRARGLWAESDREKRACVVAYLKAACGLIRHFSPSLPTSVTSAYP